MALEMFWPPGWSMTGPDLFQQIHIVKALLNYTREGLGSDGCELKMALLKTSVGTESH